MKIILLEDVKKQGKKDEIIDVKDGYAQFLIKNKQAIQVTQMSVKRLEKELDTRKKEEDNLIQEMQKLKKKLESKTIQFEVKTGEQDKVFGSITNKKISDKLKELGYKIDKNKIILNNDIQSLGFHKVDLTLHKKVTATLKVELIKEK